MRTLSLVVALKKSASAVDASTPMVLPPRWISSMAVGSTSLSQGSMSALVSSLSPFPCRERTAVVAVMAVVVVVVVSGKQLQDHQQTHGHSVGDHNVDDGSCVVPGLDVFPLLPDGLPGFHRTMPTFPGSGYR
jgi:hypothetical protein